MQLLCSSRFDIRIRGMTNGENRPTTIIDGYIGELGLLNQNDVESITVLKDAQAAIYGTMVLMDYPYHN
jgi:hypothetical protein